MAIIQPHEVTGLSDLFEEVKALRRELELLRSGLQPQPALMTDGTVGQADFRTSMSRAGDEQEAISMSPDDIRERLGKLVGDKSHESKA